jgi:hypothetical protein
MKPRPVHGDAPVQHLSRKSLTAWRVVKNRTDANLPAGSTGLIESFTEVRMNEVLEAAFAGASLAAGAAIWLLAGYLIQRFAFRNPEPTYAIVFATSLTASMLLFSLLALLTFHIRYNSPGAASGLVQTVR